MQNKRFSKKNYCELSIFRNSFNAVVETYQVKFINSSMYSGQISTRLTFDIWFYIVLTFIFFMCVLVNSFYNFPLQVTSIAGLSSDGTNDGFKYISDTSYNSIRVDNSLYFIDNVNHGIRKYSLVSVQSSDNSRWCEGICWSIC
jgi:hypothetical protein